MTHRAVIISIALLSLAACERNNLYVAHDTVIGVNAQVSLDRQQGRLVIGYDRDFVAIIPKGVETEEGPEGPQDVMALLHCTALEVDGIFLTAYADSLASGEAAIEFAKKVSGFALGDGGTADATADASAEKQGEGSSLARQIFNCDERLRRNSGPVPVKGDDE